MSNFQFNEQALKTLVQTRVVPHVKKKADEITLIAQHEAHAISRKRIPFAKIQDMVDDTPRPDGSVEIGVHRQVDSRSGNRKKSFTDVLAEKAEREGQDSWMKRAIRKHGYFKPG